MNTIGIISKPGIIRSTIAIAIGGGFVAEYQAVYDQFVVKPSEADAAAQNTFVEVLVDGGVWSELDRMFILAAHASGVDSLLDWTHPATAANAATLVNAPTFTSKQGYLGNGTSQYINHHFIPKTQGVNWTLNDNGRFGYIRSVHATNGTMFGIIHSTNRDYISVSSASATIYCNNASISGVSNIGGLWSGDRINSSQALGYFNGSQIPGTVSGTAGDFIDYELYGLCQNTNNSPGNFGQNQLSLVGYGANLGAAKQLILYNAFQALMTHYGTQV